MRLPMEITYTLNRLKVIMVSDLSKVSALKGAYWDFNMTLDIFCHFIEVECEAP
jgi:hypothetical protein